MAHFGCLHLKRTTVLNTKLVEVLIRAGAIKTINNR